MSCSSSCAKGKEELSILCISPFAPPVNHAEPIQVGRYLRQLLKTDHVKLVTEKPTGSWSVVDPSLELLSDRLQCKVLHLPFHSLTSRLLGHPALALFRPWLDLWPELFARSILDWAGPFDLIYSRSMPTRAAFLAARLKKLTGRPWIMHLSDPWADSSYAHQSKRLRALSHRQESQCFEAADAVGLTTNEQAEFYKNKYPHLKNKIFLSPNVFQIGAIRLPIKAMDDRLRLVYTGSLYGDRSPQVLLEAIADLLPPERERIEFIIAGNATPDMIRIIESANLANVQHLGPKSFSEANEIQRSAGLLLTIENSRDHPLSGAFLLGKLLDYIPLGIPLLSITPKNSVTSKIVDGRYGWAVAPDDRHGMTALLNEILAGRLSSQGRTFSDELPRELQVERAVDALRGRMRELVGT